ncbi:MAG: radical SAM family heme chaperone HemW [Proteobacteria bacterium]|nr:radical SAM family heme chaperone HemW [Pseudomonadota bacterium]
MITGAGLYIHIPFCRTKCGYCAFNSSAWSGAEGPLGYLDAVVVELERVVDSWGGDVEFATLFIGGGTPTIYGGDSLAAVIGQALRRLHWCDDPEITVETNPNTVTRSNLTALRGAGVNRLSIGVQSFVDHELASIGRSHSSAGAVAALTLAREVGFSNLNLDLIYGLPGQDQAVWRDSLITALDLEPEHLALYELSVEPGTPFAERAARGELLLPEDDTLADMEALAQEELEGHGYQRYEISNFARPGLTCRHNLNYWHNGSYLGLGAGAVSCLDGLRLKNVDDPDGYQARIAAGLPAFHEGEALSCEASFRESVIMGLRLLEGVSLASLWARYGLTPLAYYGATLERLLERGLVEIVNGQMRLTKKALPVAHQVLSYLV